MGKLIAVAVVAIVVIGGYMMLNKDNAVPSQTTEKATQTKEDIKNEVKTAGMTKDFTTTAYYDETGVWYSLKEMRVKKGDAVRIKATNTKGMHDFVIDELSVKKELPLNEEVTIEFVADKSGEFVYYCSKPGHRAKGQWGKLIVE